MKIRAFAYLRVSGLGQGNGDGFTRQRAAIEVYAAANNIEIVEWFEELGVSGKTDWENRPAWSEMIGKLNGVRTILVEKLDRLARDLFIQEYILRDLGKRDVSLQTASGEDSDDEDPARVLFRQVLGAVAQYDRAMIVHKLRVARERTKAATGRCEGKKPYGYTPVEADTLEMMKELRRDERSYDNIAAYLNTYGYTTRHGAKWYGTTVANILKRQENS